VSVSYDRVTLSLASYRCGGAEVPDPVQVALPVPLERESGVSQDHAAQRGYACGLAAATAGRSAGWPGRDACLRRAGAGAWLAEATGLGETQHKAARHHVGLACFPEILFRNVSNVKRHKCHMNDTFTCARAHHK
jgi:hypothetical protein